MNDAARIGVNVDDLRAGAKQGMGLARRLGFQAIQLGAARGELSPGDLSESGRRHVRRHAAALGLSVVALRADVGGARFLDGALVDRHVHTTCRILELARDLDVPVVSAPVGRFRSDSDRHYESIREAVSLVAEHADKVGRVFAIETAVDSPEALQRLLADLNCPNIRTCYDPAELLMDGLDPLSPIESLADHIVLSNVRDAQVGRPTRPGRETNLGQGQLNVEAYLTHLREAGYRGALILRREHSSDPVADLTAGRDYLKSVLSPEVSR